jgi:hypothetical protein
MVFVMPSQASSLSNYGPQFPDRRSRVRHKVHSPAYTTTEQSSSFILPHLNEIVDIGEDGMCFQNFSQLEPSENRELYLDLSETHAQIKTDGKIVWSTPSGRTGVRFQEMSAESLCQLRQWLFVNNVIACVNHANSSPQTKLGTDAAGLLSSTESNAPLLADHTSALVAVAAISREVVALGPDLNAALQLISDRTLALARASGAAIALGSGESMVCRASSGSDAPGPGTLLHTGSGFSGECVRTGRLLLCEDSETDSIVDRESCRTLGVRSLIAAPVRSQGAVVGLLEVFSPQAHAFTESDKVVVQRLAEIVSQAVERPLHATSGYLGVTESAPDLASPLDPVVENEKAGAFSLRSRIILASVAVAIVLALGLFVVPRVRSKAPPSQPAATVNPDSSKSVKANRSSAGAFGLEGLRQLAQQGDAESQFALGARYATGDEVKQDYVEAARWFALAADRGNAAAQSTMSAYYWSGTGVPQDLSKAYFWAILAQANGDEAAKSRATLLSARISRQELIAAQQQANEWLRQRGVTGSSSPAQ